MALLLCGCVPPPIAEPAAPAPQIDAALALPEALESLEPTPEQRLELVKLVDRLEADVAPLKTAIDGFTRALARAARRCRQDSPFIEMEARHTVMTGEQVRGDILDGINRLHSILTPPQRLALSRRLLGEQEEGERERSDRDESRTRSIGGDLDLSIGQILSMLVRVRKLRNDFEAKAEPWREAYVRVARAFRHDDFDVRDHALAEVPAVELVTDVVRDAFRVLLPLLEPVQCEALADLIEARLEEPRDAAQ